MSGFDRYSPIPPAPEPDPAKCPKCGRFTAEYDQDGAGLALHALSLEGPMIAAACAVVAPLTAPADCVATVQAIVVGWVLVAIVTIALLAAHARRR